MASALWDAAVSADGKTITLPEGYEWSGLGSNVLYVRDFYNDLWEKTLHRCTATECLSSAVVLGLPGSEFRGIASRFH